MEYIGVRSVPSCSNFVSSSSSSNNAKYQRAFGSILEGGFQVGWWGEGDDCLLYTSFFSS